MNLITAKNLKSKLANKEIILIDVREPAEYNTENIPGSHLIPLSQMSIKLVPSTSLPIVLHCQSGRRSLEACKKLSQQDPNLTLYSLDGGIIAWKEAGHEVKIGTKKIISIDRQTQIVTGALTLTGVILGGLIHINFYYLSAFVGIGLLFAGISGWCGMAKLLCVMPWNK